MSLEGVLSDSPGPFKRSRLAKQIADHLRELILVGRFSAGERMRLQPIASMLGVSTTPVREGLLLLEADGLVTSEPHQGYRVNPPSPKDVRDLFDLRASIAGTMSQRCTMELAESDLRDLHQLIEDMQQAIRQDEPDRLLGLVGRFYRIMHAAAESPMLLLLYRLTSRYVPRRFLSRIPEWVEMAVPHSEDLLEALRGRDVERARVLTERHFLRVGDLLIQYMEKQRLWSESDDALILSGERAVSSRTVSGVRVHPSA